MVSAEAGATPADNSAPPETDNRPNPPNSSPPPAPYVPPTYITPGPVGQNPVPQWQSTKLRYEAIPSPTQPYKMPTAPNGQPYLVASAPQAFYSYKNATGQQVYAAYATVRARILAALLDMLFLFIPQQIVSYIVLFTLHPDLVKRLAENRAISNELIQELGTIIPIWGLMIIYTAHMLYCTLTTAFGGGQTLGKRALKIKVITLEGGAPDFQRSLRRNLFGYCWWLGNLFSFFSGVGQLIGFFLTCMVFLGFNFALFEPKRRGWHDKLADTVVVYKNELVQGVNY